MLSYSHAGLECKHEAAHRRWEVSYMVQVSGGRGARATCASFGRGYFI
jgi:hypothetical protein